MHSLGKIVCFGVYITKAYYYYFFHLLGLHNWGKSFGKTPTHWDNIIFMIWCLFLNFYRLFETHPEYQRLFKAFADVPFEKLATNGRLLGHATSVMYALNSIIDNLEDPACLVELLHKIGSSHKTRNITPEHFQVFTFVFFYKKILCSRIKTFGYFIFLLVLKSALSGNQIY